MPLSKKEKQDHLLTVPIVSPEKKPSRVWGEVTIKMNLGDYESVDVTVGTEYLVEGKDNPDDIRRQLRAELVRNMSTQATEALKDLKLVRSGTSTAGQAAIHFKEE